MDATRLEALASKALDHGALMRLPGVIEWNAADGCHKPIRKEFEGYVPRTIRAAFAAKHDSINFNRLSVTMKLRCRQCPPCRDGMRAEWQDRADYEIATAPRTWFGTFTLNPSAHEHVANQAREYSRRRAIGSFEHLPVSKQLALRHKMIGHEFQKTLKRMRRTGYQFRYLLVMETHESGLPHYHALFHEIHGASPITWSCLSSQWHLGFTKFNLVDDDTPASAYVTKYILKSQIARIRASQNYGRPLKS